MKFLFLLLFPLVLIGQSSKNISVISAEKLNVVYRGVANPIKIAVPNIPLDRIAVSAPGLTKGEGEGNYIITPGMGKEVIVHVTYTKQDGTKETERKIFRIKNIPKPIGTINGKNCDRCIVQLTKQELLEGVIEVSMEDFLFDIDTTVRGFTIILPDNRELLVNGNVLDQIAKEEIASLKAGDIINIVSIKYYQEYDGVDYIPAVPIKIILRE